MLHGHLDFVGDLLLDLLGRGSRIRCDDECVLDRKLWVLEAPHVVERNNAADNRDDRQEQRCNAVLETELGDFHGLTPELADLHAFAQIMHARRRDTIASV